MLLPETMSTHVTIDNYSAQKAGCPLHIEVVLLMIGCARWLNNRD